MNNYVANSFRHLALATYQMLILVVNILLHRTPYLHNSKIGHWVRSRDLTDQTIDKLLDWRKKQKRVIVMFCSSAGEYEQAKPISDQLRLYDVGCIYVFFSPSGYEFASKREESDPFILAPFDLTEQWQRFFDAVNPCATIVIRHELWPNFLHVAKSKAPLLLANASFTTTSYSNFIKKWLFRYFTKIFVVDEQDVSHFISTYKLQEDSIQLSGDTKYERVIQRTKKPSSRSNSLGEIFDRTLNRHKRLIIGSAWPADLEIALAGLTLYHNHYPNLPAWKLIVAPHDLSEKNIATMIQTIECHGYQWLRTSSWATYAHHDKPLFNTALILDEMGVLAEAYGICDGAFVGGANHHRVHNVLEPAAHGLPITHGPCYNHQREAILMVDRKLSTVTNSALELSSWLARLDQESAAIKTSTAQFLACMGGASGHIVSYITKNC